MNKTSDLTVSSEMHQQIQTFLKKVEIEHGVEILYACESGSRAWGFASPDSDYDIRFIFTNKEVDYLSVSSVKDNIEIPIKDDLDAGGWDVKKSLSLLRKSNGALIEWLHSPIVYFEKEGFLDEWRSTVQEVMAESGLLGHYRGLAVQMWKGQLQSDKVRAKSYLYCLRAVLSAKWILSYRENPPVAFVELLKCLKPELEKVVDDLLAAKSVSGEKELMCHIPELDIFLEQSIVEPWPDDLSMPKEKSYVIEKTFKDWVSRGGRISSVNNIDLARVNQKDLLLFKSIAGSQAYGTSHKGSDIDYRGVFALPNHLLGGLDSLDQVQDERGDDVYFELGKVLSLLQKNNPNLMELLYMPKDCIIHKNRVWNLIDPEVFLSKKCEQSFANYAIGQVKKARGLNKKIVNPEPEVRKELIDFCYVMQGQGSVPLADWGRMSGLDITTLGVVSSQHAPNVYSLYNDKVYRGVFSQKAPYELICSSVDIDSKPVAWMVCNVDAFKKHCKSHAEYWQWVKNRNENRYQSNNEKGYDSKNMMHTLRLLDVAEEIATEGLINVRRPNRDFLMKVLAGEFEYDYLLSLAEDKMLSVREAYANSSLQEEPSYESANQILMEMRAELR